MDIFNQQKLEEIWERSSDVSNEFASFFPSKLQRCLHFVPKVDLHAHLNGSISVGLLKYLAALRFGTQSSIVLTMSEDADTLANIEASPARMKHCFTIFDAIYRIMDNLPYTILAVQDMLVHYALEHTYQLEIRTTLRDGLLSACPPNVSAEEAPSVSSIESERMKKADYLLTVLRACDMLRTGNSIYYLDESSNEVILVSDIFGESCVPAMMKRREAALNWFMERYGSLLSVMKAERKGSCTSVDSLASTMQELMRRVSVMKVSVMVGINRASGGDEAMDVILATQDVMCSKRRESFSNRCGTTLSKGEGGEVGCNRTQQVIRDETKVVGVDVSGNCYKGTFEELLPALHLARDELKLNITVHAAEREDEEELRQIIEFGPLRYGHLCFASDTSVERIKTQKVLNAVTNEATRPCIELCLTSNMLTSNHASITDHHITSWITPEDMARVCSVSEEKDQSTFSSSLAISTDDRGVFYTSMTQELLVLCQHTELFSFLDASVPEEARIRDQLWVCMSLMKEALSRAF